MPHYKLFFRWHKITAYEKCSGYRGGNLALPVF
jgi:hypothetical protein